MNLLRVSLNPSRVAVEIAGRLPGFDSLGRIAQWTGLILTNETAQVRYT